MTLRGEMGACIQSAGFSVLYSDAFKSIISV